MFPTLEYLWTDRFMQHKDNARLNKLNFYFFAGIPALEFLADKLRSIVVQSSLFSLKFSTVCLTAISSGMG